MESNDPSDATPTDRGKGDEDGTEGSDDAATVSDASLESPDSDDATDSIPEDVPGRPAGTPDASSTDGGDAASGAPSPSGDAGRAESPVDEATATDSQSELAPDQQYCYSCGAVIKREAVICPECGVSQEQSSSSDGDPGVAALLSAIGFIFPIAAGAGQLYNGQVGKGIAFSAAQLFNVFLFLVLIGFITYPLVGIWAVYDAYQHAQ